MTNVLGPGEDVENKFYYQDKMVESAVSVLREYSKPVVLAMTTSSGKSATITKILNRVLGKDKTAVFIGSNLTTLCEQYYSTLVEEDPVQPKFTFSKITEPNQSQLKIGLPCHLKKNESRCDYFILDEAQWLWARRNDPNSLIGKALESCGNPKIILMTGTPAAFNKNKGKYNILYLAHEEIQASSVFAKLDIDVVRVFNRNELRLCIDEFLKSSKIKNDDISKTVIVARNISEATDLHAILKEKGYSSIISSSKHDKKSENLDKFKTGGFQFCITVSRVIAGWSFTELTCVLDLRSSYNLTNTFQLISRLFRVSKSKPSVRKVYYRVATRDAFNRTVKFLHAVLALTNSEIFRGFNGFNLKLKVE